MISLQDDYAEPDLEETAARLTADSGFVWNAGRRCIRAGIFSVLA
jgi:hypothetical protein